MKIDKAASSFRDPSGFVFVYEKEIYRQINSVYKENYDLLMNSGLYQELTKHGLLIEHQESDLPIKDQSAYKIIKPTTIPFISYSYEWCFSQLKDAALLTLRIQKIALKHGLSLKDASSFNVQFLAGRPIFIDTLSFEKYEEGKPWVAYKQFCEHFLAPLALISYTDARLGKLSLGNIEGVPLDLAARLLPWNARFNPSLLLHIFLHARSQQRFSGEALPKGEQKNKRSFSRQSFLGLLDSLEASVRKMRWQQGKTIWTDYYGQDNCVSYEDESLTAKKKMVATFLKQAKTERLWDVGANAGLFSEVAAKNGVATISMDYDPTVVEQNYLRVKKNKEKNILPLLVDVINPTPAIGWHNREREDLLSRSLPDTALALALVHHLAIGKNLPFSKIAEFFADIAPNLIIEFVPKSDRQTKLLLSSREDIFADYNEKSFEENFGRWFEIKEKITIPNSERTLYLMLKK